MVCSVHCCSFIYDLFLLIVLITNITSHLFGKQPKIILLILKQFLDLLQKSAGIRSLSIQT